MASTLASRIRDALEKREGANQSALAKACNVSRATVTDWLNGDIKELKADSLLRAAGFLGVRPEWLLWDEAPMRPQALTADERELLALWRKMDDDQRKATVGVAKLGSWISHPVQPNIAPAPELPAKRQKPRPSPPK